MKGSSVTVILTVTAVGVVLAWRAGAGAFALLLAGICLFVGYCRRRTAQTKASATRPDAGIWERFRYELLRCAAFYFVPVAVALAFYVVLLIYIAWLADDVSLDWLMSMQRAFEGASSTFKDNFVLKPSEVFVALVCLYVLSCALLAGRGHAPGRSRLVALLQHGVDAYGKHTARIATCLATLASLTLFGTQLGAPASDLRLRIKDTQNRYAELARRTEVDFTQRVAAQLYTKIRDALPPSYGEALELPQRQRSLATLAGHDASRARSQWAKRVAVVDRIVRRDTARSIALRSLRSNLVVPATGRRSPPGSVTQNRVEAASSIPIDATGRGIELMSIGRKKIVLHVEKLASAQIVNLTRPLVEAAPVLKPVLQAFVSAVDTTVQARIERAYDGVMSARLSEAGISQARIEREAKAVVDATSVAPAVDLVSRQAVQEARLARDEFSSLKAGRASLRSRVAQARARARRRAERAAEAERRRREQEAAASRGAGGGAGGGGGGSCPQAGQPCFGAAPPGCICVRG